MRDFETEQRRKTLGLYQGIDWSLVVVWLTLLAIVLVIIQVST